MRSLLAFGLLLCSTAIAIQTPGTKLGFTWSAGSSGYVAPAIWGGYDGDTVKGIALDSAGRVYVTGTTLTDKFPAPAAAYPPSGGTLHPSWGYVAKLANDGHSTEWTTIVNGVRPCGIALARDGGMVIAGDISDFETMTPPIARFGKILPGGMAVVRMNSAGEILFVSVVAGWSQTTPVKVAIDAAGAIYVAGTTYVRDFPVTADAYQSSASSTPTSGFVTKFSADGRSLLYSTLFGGTSTSAITDMVLDSTGAVVITGTTQSTDFPVTYGVLNPAPTTNGGFLARLHPGWPRLSALLFSTYLDTKPASLLLDASGDILVAGGKPADSPTMPGVQIWTASVARINSTGTALRWNRPLDGISGWGLVMATDASGNIYLAQPAGSAAPVYNAIEPTYTSGYCPIYTNSGYNAIGTRPCAQGYVAGFDPTGSHLLFATYLNADSEVSPVTLAVDAQSRIYLGGRAIEGYPAGEGSAFVQQYLPGEPPPAITSKSVTNGASFVSNDLMQGGIASIFLTGLTDISGIMTAGTLPLPASMAGVTVTVNDKPAPLFAIAQLDGYQQINFQIPYVELHPSIPPETAQGFKLEVTQNGRMARAWYGASAAAPGIFTTGGTNAAALHADYRPVTASDPAAPGEVVIVYATGLGPVAPPVAEGTAAPLSPLSFATAPLTMTVGGKSAEVLFAGLAPGFAGLYQLNVRVPAGAPSGADDMIVSFPDYTDYSAYPYVVQVPRPSKPVKLSVR